MSVTVAIIKPDAMSLRIAGIILTRIEDAGFNVVECQTLAFTPDGAARFYAEHAQRDFFEGLCGFMASRPVMAMLLERENAEAEWRAILGPTDPRKARAAWNGCAGSPRNLRGMYGDQTGAIWKNVAHGSNSDEAAKRETDIVFGIRSLHVPPRIIGLEFPQVGPL